MRVAVLAGGQSSEHDVSLESAKAVREGLAAGGHEVVSITILRSGVWLHDDVPIQLWPGQGLLDVDVVFPVLHGPYGEDGTLQGLLELLNIPYVGAGVCASAICMDKVLFKRVLASLDIPHVDRYEVLTALEWEQDRHSVQARLRDRLADYKLPVFVKPVRTGSSKGISRVDNYAELAQALDIAFKYDRDVIIEGSISGIEVECSLIGNDIPEVSTPGQIEVLNNASWYDYAAKYEPGGMRLKVPADISPSVQERVKKIAGAVFFSVGCAGLARADFFVDGDEIRVNELNTMPGFTMTSVFPKLWQASGLSFNHLCDRLLSLAVERYEIERNLQRTTFTAEGLRVQQNEPVSL